MKFHIYVDAAAAIRAGNEAIHSQVVEVPLSDFSDEERAIVAESHVDTRGVVHVDRYVNGLPRDRVAVLDRADPSAVRALIAVRLTHIARQKAAKHWAERHVRAALEATAKAMPRTEGCCFDGTPNRYERRALAWLSRAYPQAWAEFARGYETPLQSLQDLRYELRLFSSLPVEARDGTWISTDGLPDDPDGHEYLRTHASAMLKADPDLDALWTSCVDRRVAELEDAFEAELDARRDEIEAVFAKARAECEEKARHEALLLATLDAADRAQPDLSLAVRWRAGILPESELKAALRGAAFAALDDLKRHRRIRDEEVKRRRRTQKITYQTVPSTSVHARPYALATLITGRLPAARVEHVVHQALLDGEVMLERPVVRVTLMFAGVTLQREYVPDGR